MGSIRPAEARGAEVAWGLRKHSLPRGILSQTSSGSAFGELTISGENCTMRVYNQCDARPTPLASNIWAGIRRRGNRGRPPQP